MICLYLIIPCYNEEEVLLDTAHILKEKINALIKCDIVNNSSRIVFVNDGSTDNTADIIHELNEEDELFSGIHFSRNFGHQNAVMAGYNFAKGICDVAISIDADLQQDINAIDEFIQKYNDGYDIVFGVRNDRKTDGFFKKTTSQMFYKLMKILGCDTIPNHADYRLLANNVLETLGEFNETNVFLRGLIPELGYKSCIVKFDVHDRTMGKSKYSMKKMVNLAVDGITSHSIKPMHFIFIGGILVVLCGLINIIYTLVAFIGGNVVSGWTTIVISIWVLGGLQLIATGCVGEYVGKNYLESKRRPRYIIESIEHRQNTSRKD